MKALSRPFRCAVIRRVPLGTACADGPSPFLIERRSSGSSSGQQRRVMPSAPRTRPGARRTRSIGWSVTNSSLTELWCPSAVAELQERLHAALAPAAQLNIVEDAIAERIPPLRGLHPAVASGLEQFRLTTNVTAAVRASGYSHRTVAEQFQRTMGVGPKAYVQTARMRRLLPRIGAVPRSDLAAETGFSDQAHFVREFRKFTGTTPTAYLRSRPVNPYHFRIVQDGPTPTR